ncbi:phospholipase [Bradyrhizobium tropiciagri]|uniref:carboxylesterase family protein n=1 Tax=Bradyrhizobium tropiciagri TaxID=312253 RepID=UPI001BAE3F29|nr:phospholipase [Bradyrhizobium tropiciagri]MBR0875445.1 phospholipase [Bradyrhizobium tropiciagri]
MTEAVVDDIVAVLPPLLQTLESLAFVARNLNPAEFGNVMQIAGEPDEALQAVKPRLAEWPEKFSHIRTALEASIDAALAGYAGLREVASGQGDLVSVFRALRYLPRAQEALYPLTEWPPVSGFFLTPELREDAALQAKLSAAPSDNTGVFHEGNEPGGRGGFSMYVPEYYTPDRAWPLVMALHGGSGNGRSFLWSWLRDARSRGAILIAPTATGQTWALMGNDTDTPNLNRILGQARQRWNIDETRMLLTGMSDGGTFSYVSGLDGASRFTHLAPVAATFHPLMAEMADAERLRGLPIFITHGQLDWMFPVQTARQTQGLLSAAGARVTYREIDDLSHCYPREINAEILQWLNGE